MTAGERAARARKGARTRQAPTTAAELLVNRWLRGLGHRTRSLANAPCHVAGNANHEADQWPPPPTATTAAVAASAGG